MAITHKEKLVGYVNDPAKAVSKNAWVDDHDTAIVNSEVATNAAIVESKLSLNFPTHSNALDHSNANDPSASEKGALVGTNGTASTANAYVTNSDPRNSDARTPVTHVHAASDITSGTISGTLLPAISTNAQGAVPQTGTPSGKFLKDDGTWAVSGAGTGDVIGPATNTNLYIPQWNGTDSKTLSSGLPVDLTGGLASKAYVDLASGAVINAAAYGCVGDAKQYLDATVAEYSATVTTVGSYFTTADVGKMIVITGGTSPYEVFTGYTEQDTGGYLSETTNKVTATNMPANVTSYLYADGGTNFISGDFTHYFDFLATQVSGTGYMFPWAVSDTLGLPRTNGTNLFVQIAAAGNGANGTYIYLIERYGGTQYNTTAIVLNGNTHYYLTIIRSGTTATVHVYTDAARTSEVGTSPQSITLHSVQGYRYVYGMTSASDIGTGVCSGYSNNMSLGGISGNGTHFISTIASYVSATQITMANSLSFPGGSNFIFAYGTDNFKSGDNKLQNAIDAARDGGIGSVMLPAGKYLGSGSLNLWSGITLTGAAQGPFLTWGNVPNVMPSLSQLWITNTSQAFISMCQNVSGTATSGSNLVAVADSSKFFKGQQVSYTANSGAVVQRYVGLQDIPDATHINVGYTATFTGAVTVAVGMISPGVTNLMFYYPSQIQASSTLNPMVFPATIRITNSYGYKIRNCFLLNPYVGIGIGWDVLPSGAYDTTMYGSGNGSGIIEDLYIGPIYVGIGYDHVNDVSYMTNVYIGNIPDFTGATIVGFPSNLDTWIMANGYGLLFYRCDDFKGNNIFIYLRNKGIAIYQSPDASVGGITESYGTGNQIEFDSVNDGIEIESTRGTTAWIFTNVVSRTGGIAGGGSFCSFKSGGSGTPVIEIIGGQVDGSWSGGAFNFHSRTGTMNIQGVLGFNQAGLLSAPAVPASTTPILNPFPYPCLVNVAGGTVTDVNLNNQPSGLTHGSFYLCPGWAISITYSAAPTWTWFGL